MIMIKIDLLSLCEMGVQYTLKVYHVRHVDYKLLKPKQYNIFMYIYLSTIAYHIILLSTIIIILSATCIYDILIRIWTIMSIKYYYFSDAYL